MKHVKYQFTQHLSDLGNLLTESSQQKNPASWLLNNDARTKLFYLESITRLLTHFDNKKTWVKLNKLFKKLEDSLGAMGHFNELIQELKDSKKIPKEILSSLIEQKELVEFKTNALLQKKRWIGKKENSQLNAIKKHSKKINWPNDILFKENLHYFYNEQISLIQEQIKNPLTNIESGIHELRRDIRWLSIYPQACKGFLRLKSRRVVSKRFDKYLTNEAINSPFNQLSQATGITEPVLLNQPNFYAVSWLISTLGELKDQGLKLEALAKEWSRIDSITEEQAHILSLKALGSGQATKEQLLFTANTMVKQLNRDGILSDLLVPLKK